MGRHQPTRRGFLKLSAATLGVAWVPAGVLPSAAAASAAPPGFPQDVELYRQRYENWAGEIRVDDVWTCAPRTAAAVLEVVNWAYTYDYRVRPRGYRHTWSPLTVTTAAGGGANILLVDLTRHLTSTQVMSMEPAVVRAETGTSMDALLGFLETAGLGLTNTPAPGDLSVGGVLAINGHGTSVPAASQPAKPAHAFGSLSNLVLSLTAVVWSPAAGRYVLRSFERADPECEAFLTHVGRAFLTEVTLRVEANDNLRCVSRVDIPVTELFAAPGDVSDPPARTFATFVESTGRVEAIWFAFTTNPWLKIWSVAPNRPVTSRPAVTPYNYVFSDNVPAPVSDLADQMIHGAWELTPTFGQLQYAAAAAGLTATATTDLWGPSKNLLLYVKPTTLRETANGYAVLTNRGSIQRVVSEFAAFFSDRLSAYQARGEYPVTGQVEIRVGGLDHAGDLDVSGARSPGLSAVRPRSDHPDWDVAVWFDVLTFPTAPRAAAFYRELEAFFFNNYTGDYAGTRAEWSKGWAYTDDAAWSDQVMITQTVPNSYRQGSDSTWDSTLSTLNKYDPRRLFGNDFLDALLPG